MEHYLTILKDTVTSVKYAYDMYAGVSINLLPFYLALFYLFCSLRRKADGNRQDRAILCLVGLVAFVIVFPLTAWFIMKYCVQPHAYRRLFWMIPVPLIVGYVGARIVGGENTKLRKWLVGGLLAVILIATGSGLYNNANFAKAGNLYKIPDSVIAVGEALKEDAEEQGTEEIRVVTNGDMAIYLRQYDAGIAQAFGREQMEGRSEGKLATQIYGALSGTAVNTQALAFYAKKGNYQYLVTGADESLISSFLEAGYELTADVGGYYIYRLDMEAVSDILITQYGDNEGNQINFYTIETAGGKLIVVDGGFEADEEYVREILASKGNKVNAWILTHYHQDHIGAFCSIYKNPDKIRIGKIYAVTAAPMELYVENAPWDETYTLECFQELEIEKVKYLHAGDELKIAGVPITVLNAYDDYVDEISDDLHNDGSMMFKVYGEKESMLFCADVGERMSEWIMEHYGEELSSDYLQMGHHGNGGLS